MSSTEAVSSIDARPPVYIAVPDDNNKAVRKVHSARDYQQFGYNHFITQPLEVFSVTYKIQNGDEKIVFSIERTGDGQSEILKFIPHRPVQPIDEYLMSTNQDGLKGIIGLGNRQADFKGGRTKKRRKQRQKGR